MAADGRKRENLVEKISKGQRQTKKGKKYSLETIRALIPHWFECQKLFY